MKRRKRMWTWILILFWILTYSVPSYAHDVPDLDKKCSITITMRMGDKSVGGGSLTLYRVGDVYEENGNYDFRLTEDFADSRISLEDLTSVATAEKIASYVKSHSLKEWETKTIGKNGKVKFSDLEVGLYLMIQKEPAKGYLAINPFLVSLPYLEEGIYCYDLEAGPKSELKREPETTVPQTPPSETPPEEQLPVTGQLDWPIPALVMGGLVLFTAGWILCFGKMERYEE